MATLENPYRAADEPRGEELFSVPLMRVHGKKTLTLGGTAFVALLTSAVAAVTGATAIGAGLFVVFLGAAGTMARHELGGHRKTSRQLVLTRVGATTFLRAEDRDGRKVSLRFPLTTSGWSRGDDEHYVAALVLRDADRRVVTVGGGIFQTGTIPLGAREDEWFDGARQPDGAGHPTVMMSLDSLVALRAAIEAVPSLDQE